MAGKYQDYLSDFRAALKTVRDPSLTVWCGSSDYLVAKSSETWRQAVTRAGVAVDSLEAKELNEEKFFALFEQQSLFADVSGVLIRRCEQQASLPKWLKKLKAIQRPVSLVYGKEKVPATYTKEIKRLGGSVVACVNPAPRELPSVVSALAKKKKIDLSREAVELIIEALGAELGTIDQEIDKLALVLNAKSKDGDVPSGPLAASAIAPYLGALRQDHAFALDRHLIDGRVSKAQALLEDLLNRGAAPLQLLGILSMHCRTALSIQDHLADGVSQAQLPSVLKTQPWKIRNYLPYARKASSERLRVALSLCADADRQFKSSNVTPRLVLGPIIEQLRPVPQSR